MQEPTVSRLLIARATSISDMLLLLHAVNPTGGEKRLQLVTFPSSDRGQLSAR
jgi:hypothetical protein